ncbi:hypothetical protein [Qipengyuania soli]|uniref:Uncharacterized protein n=1 Tax=Qipengyuania soli TaxID=2782568 RepID=A0A7S8IVA4_9SPHN|nr:hypothetical protein [Qipengyuania soli]QPC99632.1 hypothetical protein IRL76_03420 [Qipengyuania soli]
MTKTRHLLASAPIAIAAMAALSATPTLAQETPVIVLDVPTPASSPAPVIAIPEAVPTATATSVAGPDSEPVARTGTPVSEPAATTASPRRATSAPTARTAVTPAAPSAAATELPTEAVAAPTADILPTANEAEIAAARAELESIPEPVKDGSSAALLFALLAAGGVGLAAFFLVRSLRRRVVDVPVIEQPVVTRPVDTFDREPAVTAYDAAPLVATPALEPTAPIASSNGAAVEIPPVAPKTERERDNLLRRMIAAKPDRANPFQSHKARAKRARLILQSIGTRFTDRKPGIDLSQYTNVWPELRGWRPATA